MSSLHLESILEEIDSKILWNLYKQNEKDTPEGVSHSRRNRCNVVFVNLIEENWSESSIKKIKKYLSQVLWPKGFQGPVQSCRYIECYSEEILIIGWILEDGGGKTKSTTHHRASFFNFV